MARFPVNSNAPIESASERAQRRKQAGTYKRLLIFCDGTGQQTDAPVACPETKTWTESAQSWLPWNKAPALSDKDAQATDHNEWVPASNVTRLCRIIADVDYTKDGKEIEQMTFYQNGVATGALTALGETWSGAFGVGLNENICEAYVWLCLNWIPGDGLVVFMIIEIFIFGFSRGAFTARALSGLIFHLGMIDRSNLGEFHSIYDAYTKRAEASHAQAWKNKKKQLQEDGLGCSDLDIVKIKVVGVWDTVKSLGMPENERVRRWMKSIGWDRKHAFHDAFTCENVENAFHALALDEKRAAFSPTLWYLPPTAAAGAAKTHLQQCWFSGAHSDVGGSYADAQPFDSSDLSLLWMIRQCRPLLAFNNKCLERELEPYEALRWWGAQPLHDSYTLQFYLNGQEIRRPGQYFEMQDVAAPAEVGPRNELVHASVRLRLLRARMLETQKKASGRGVENAMMGLRVKADDDELSDRYDCRAMAGFRLALVNPAEPRKGYKWVKKIDGGKVVELIEDQLGEDERNMLDHRVRELLDDPAKNVGVEFPELHAAETGSKTPGMLGKVWGYLG
ncbi:hypothetical protein GGX14DRAFT_567027 [Mycena pura]|uniref:T6SS Phospholipase effector Tle1-like catalytic domain-containing protein n=1 Tax=Mycena pura TaxID=153505 RepID=A0AAD6VBK3_9AGAR|nr:hypothetical protein GGX14DRAFT_567027 [Mycena pura]